MTTSLEMLKLDTHAVGYFTSIVEPRQLDEGAKCSVDIDNTELVEVYFDETDKETLYCKPLTSNDVTGYIVMSSEKLHYPELETKANFWNGEGTMANVYVQESGTTFKTTNYACATEVEKGMYAQWKTGASTACPKANGHFNITKEKPEGKNVFLVVNATTDETYELLSLPTVELQVLQ